MLRVIPLLLLISTLANGQDTIAKLSGEKLFVKVLANTTNTVDFTYPNETAVNSLPKSLVGYVVFASGRKETFSKIVDTEGFEGWRNVLISNNPDDVVGLVRLGEINATVLNMYGVLNTKDVEAKASERIKKATSALGAHIVLTQQNYTRLSSFKSGVAYGYPFKNAGVGMPTSGESARRYFALQRANNSSVEPADLKGQKAVFEVDGEFYVGETLKRSGNFYKVKYTNREGKEETTSRHVEKVAFVTSK
ncbi:hypothetical protein A6C57_23280 [Fibrella sp. ES10-3-2-2]|nr:hypothetical protein A6C57_23280 [Fibrella sp. ES10-3-2-2]